MLGSLNNMAQGSKEHTEVVIVDDGSHDRSMDIVEQKKRDLSPIQFVIIKRENWGTATARNVGLKHSRGEWIFFLDADDELAFDPIPYLNQSSNFSVVGFSVRLYKDLKFQGIRHPILITPKNHFDIFTAANVFTISNIIFKKNKIKSLFDTSFIYMEDWLFWMMNPSIFDNMKIFHNMISAIIHSHDGNKSSNYVSAGKYRKKAAEEILTKFGDRLTRKQKNNLMIQAQIGLIQQGKKITLDTFLRFSCDMKLYMKLIIYFLLRSNFGKFDFYGR